MEIVVFVLGDEQAHDTLLKAANTSQFHINEKDIIYIEQRFDLPPQLMKNNRQFKESLLVQSNPSYRKYDWEELWRLTIPIQRAGFKRIFVLSEPL